MNALTTMMNWGLKLKARPLRKDRHGNPLPIRHAVWINRPLAEVQEALTELVVGRHWDYSLDEARDGQMTRLEVVDRTPSEGNGLDPDLALEMEVRQIKACIETGEAPTVLGQPHGERSRLGESAEEVFLKFGSRPLHTLAKELPS
jgi:hypothetical protein